MKFFENRETDTKVCMIKYVIISSNLNVLVKNNQCQKVNYRTIYRTIWKTTIRNELSAI